MLILDFVLSVYKFICKLLAPVAPVLLGLVVALGILLQDSKIETAQLAWDKQQLEIQVESLNLELKSVLDMQTKTQVLVVENQEAKQVIENKTQERLVIIKKVAEKAECKPEEYNHNVLKQRLPDEIIYSLDPQYKSKS